MRRLRVLTWHIHGNYLWYLSQAYHDFVLPVKQPAAHGYGGRGQTFPFGPNVTEVPAEQIAREKFDCILFQHRQNWEIDQHEILTPQQRALPRIYLEHDPPQEHPTDTRHWMDDPNVLLVHVTPFNRLMWDCGLVPTRVIEHGVLVPEGVSYSGELPRGIVVVNHLKSRGRRLGADVFEEARQDVPLDLVGMAAEEMRGLGEIPPPELAAFICRYRFFFNPIRYTSLGLAVCEAMTLGLPIVGLATTEMATAIQNGVSGYVDTNLARLVEVMRELIRNPSEARRLGEGARRYAAERFEIGRFAAEWTALISEVVGTRSHGLPKTAGSSRQTVLAGELAGA